MQGGILVHDVTPLPIQPVQSVCHVWLPQGSALHTKGLPLRIGMLPSCFSILEGKAGWQEGERGDEVDDIWCKMEGVR